MKMALLLILFAAIADAQQSDFIPLAKGNFWLYEAQLEWKVGIQYSVGPEKSGRTVRDTKTWKSEVIETSQKDNVFLAVLNGFPWDLRAYHGENIKPEKWAIVIIDGKKFYSTSYELLQREFDDFLSGTVSPDSLLQKVLQKVDKQRSIFLELPLYDQKFFGEPGQRNVPGAGWWVEAIKPLPSDFPFNTSGQLHLIMYASNTHEEELMIVPGIGIVGYTNNQHRWTAYSKCFLKLIEFHKVAD